MVFVAVTEKTGWTPEQILSLTLYQLKEYMRLWFGTGKDKNTNPGKQEIEMFNLFAGIKKVKKK